MNCLCEHCPAPGIYTVRTDRTYQLCTACLDTLAANHDWEKR